MSQVQISDAAIAAMSPTQRAELIGRLKRPLAELVPMSVADRLRRAHIGLMIGGAVGLIPWIVHLAVTLPKTYAAQDWPATWVGFDIVRVGFMTATAVLGWLRRQVLVLTAFTTGILLICDAWFDIMTAGRGELPVALVTAGLGELPLAVVLIGGASRIVRLTMTRLWLIQRGISLWRLPLLP